MLGVDVSSESSAAGRWDTDKGGEYFAAGVGGSITGRRADLALLDDPLRSREDADSKLIRDKQWDWFKFDLCTRLKPNASIILIQCMTGDTPVLMADGNEKPLREIRPGDVVATYKNGMLSTSKVVNHASNGVDRVFRVKTTSGITVRANERHPFLIYEGGTKKWVKTKDLSLGLEIFRVSGANGKVKPVLGKGATNQLFAEGIVQPTTTKSVGQTELDRLRSILNLVGTRISCTVTELLERITTKCLPRKTVSALCVNSLQAKMSERTGAGNFASITATKQGRLEGFSVMTATLSSGMQRLLRQLQPQQNTSDFILEKIVEVSPAGIEEVFDVQIEDTENFIANGLVSHNTRWHEDDLAGRVLAEEADRWRVVSLPMEATSHDDPLDRSLGQPLWPEWFNDEMRSDAKRDSRVWSALYQQQPTPDEGGLFKRDWFHPVNTIPDRDTMMVYGGSDYAVTSNGGDYTVHCVVGLDPDGEMYLLDVWRKQASSDEWVDAWCDLVRKWKPMAWAEETGQIKSGVGPFLERRAVERQAYCVREQFPTRGDKAVRAQSIRGRMAMRGLRIQKDAPWRADFESELLRFPAGVHDDQVDALGLVGQLLDRMLAGTKPRPTEQPRKDRYERDDDDYGENSWKTV